MEQTRYLIVGGGMTAAAAVKGIREHDSDGRITLVGAERHPPYKRPPLTKKLWAGGDEEKIWIGTADDGADLKLGRRIGASISMPSGRPTAKRRSTPTSGFSCDRRDAARIGVGDQEVIYYRTLDDYRRLRELAREGAHAVVIGGGFIGSDSQPRWRRTVCG
jgi:NAD(P)H-nitrite reductase large subunit